MKIVLMRHYKVAFDYASSYTGSEFDAASIGYNTRDVYDQSPPVLTTEKLYASDMHRAQMTARLAFKREPEVLGGVYEVTMKRYTDSPKVMPRWWWEFMARVHFRLKKHTQYEHIGDVHKRLNRAIDVLEQRGEDATVVMHGMAMRHMSGILKKRGYKGSRAFKAKNGECFTYIKD